jgi:hypothetical protein
MQPVALQGTSTKANSTTTVYVSPNPVLVGNSVQVSFIVEPEPGNTLTPFGKVRVQVSTGESCWVPSRSNGCTFTFATPVDRTITATFEGDSYFNPSTSSNALLRVVDLSLSVSPSSQTVSTKKTTYTLTLTAVNGFSGPVSFGCAGGPPNTTCAVSPNPVDVSGQTAKPKATVTVPSGAPGGTYTMTFTGSFAGGTRSATANLIVN